MSHVSDSDHRRLEAVAYPDCVVESHQISDASRGLRRVQVTKVWRTERLLGRGGFGEVHLQSQDSDKDAKRALKIIPTRGVRLSLDDCQRELTAMIEFTKPKYRDAAVFVDFIGWFQNDDAMFLAMEYMPLGDLEQNMKEIEKSLTHTGPALPEEEVQEIARQILEGLKIMHAEGFAHRDLKPQNVFVVQRHPQWWIKLGDFGLSKKRTDGTAYRTQAGTQEYMAPEIFYYVQELDTETSEYTNAIDMWSLGCIIYRVVTGKVPFPTMLFLRNYCMDQSRVPLDMPSTMEEAGKFVKALLTPHPARRPVASAAMESPWLTTKNKPTIIMNNPETSFAALDISRSQNNYITASHKGLQPYYTMPTATNPLPNPVKNGPVSEPLPSISESIPEPPKGELQLELQKNVKDRSTLVEDSTSTLRLAPEKVAIGTSIQRSTSQQSRLPITKQASGPSKLSPQPRPELQVSMLSEPKAGHELSAGKQNLIQPTTAGNDKDSTEEAKRTEKPGVFEDTKSREGVDDGSEEQSDPQRKDGDNIASAREEGSKPIFGASDPAEWWEFAKNNGRTTLVPPKLGGKAAKSLVEVKEEGSPPALTPPPHAVNKFHGLNPSERNNKQKGQSSNALESRFDQSDSTGSIPVLSTAPRTPISKKVDKPSALVYGVVLYDFRARAPDELEAKKGETIVLLAQANQDWVVATPVGRLGGPGLIPLSYVEIRDVFGLPVLSAHEALSGAGLPTVEEWKKTAADSANKIPTPPPSLGIQSVPGSGETRPLIVRKKPIMTGRGVERDIETPHSDAPHQGTPKPGQVTINSDDLLFLHPRKLGNLTDTLPDEEDDHETVKDGKVQPENGGLTTRHITNRVEDTAINVPFKIAPSPSLDSHLFTTIRDLRLILNSYGVVYPPDATRSQLRELLATLVRSPSTVKRRRLNQLPPGWTKRLSHDGRVYYRDGIEHFSTWTDPRTVDIEDLPQNLTGSQMPPSRSRPQETENMQPSGSRSIDSSQKYELTPQEVQNINLFSTLIGRLQHFPAGTILQEPQIQLLYDSMGSLRPRLLGSCHEITLKHDTLIDLYAKITRILRLRPQLSFITARDQSLFERLFSSAVGNEQKLSGDKAMEIFWRSGLNGDTISRIWTLADTTRAGQLHFPEFALAMYLCNMKIGGKSLPTSLPRNITIEILSMIETIEGGVAGGPSPSSLATKASDLTTRERLAAPPVYPPAQSLASTGVSPLLGDLRGVFSGDAFGEQSLASTGISPLLGDLRGVFSGDAFGEQSTALGQPPQSGNIVDPSGSSGLLWPSSVTQPLSRDYFYEATYRPPSPLSQQYINDKWKDEPKKSKKLGFFSKLLGRQSGELPVMNSQEPHKRTGRIDISVKTLAGNVIPVNIGLTETIGYLKTKIHHQEGIPPGYQRLIYAGKQLDDHRTVEAYNILHDATVHLVLRLESINMTEERNDQITVIVKTLMGIAMEFKIGQGESVWTLKYMIFLKEGILLNQQRLIFAGRQLEDRATLSDYRIQHKATIHLILRLDPALASERIEIYIKTLTGLTITLSTNQNNTISSLKDQMQEKEGIPPHQQRLIFAGKELENDRTLAYYGIQNQSILHITLWVESARETIEISIKTLTGKSIKLMVSPIETMKSIYEKIQDKEGIPPDQQLLVFAGKQLQDEHTVKESNIQNGATLYLMRRLRGLDRDAW